jgi:hypothetical protein
MNSILKHLMSGHDTSSIHYVYTKLPPLLEPWFAPDAQTKATKRCRKGKMRHNATGGSCGEENENRVCNFQFDNSVEMRTSTEKGCKLCN